MLGVRDEELAAAVVRDTGAWPPMPLGGMRDLDESVRQSVRRIRDCGYLQHRDAVSGHVLDIESGALRQVD